MPASESTKRRRQTVPKLKESCDCCASAKVRCSREQPSCLRCRQRGFNCEYSISRRAGRQTRTISSDTSSPRQTSSSSASSYTGSPLTSPMLPPYSHPQRHNTSDASSDSSYFSTPQLGGAPIVPQMLSYGSNIEAQTLQAWGDGPTSAFMDSPTSVSSEWGHLSDSFAFPTTEPQHHHQFEPSSPIGSMSPRQLAMDIASLQQESYLFMETEAIKEELNLAANFIGTLEERIDKGIGNFKMCSDDPKNQFGALQNDCLQLADSSHLVAYHFTAVDLRRRLQSIRRDIEGIAGLSC
ncbi:Aflatoxin biosynthesis regulatory protein [Pseudocercospora fuligena]|uniref:Aflatoxin biosynthesis regulatory protein n=1 Tax=Pseudocercospora fuligena TaxID=685502 RepID=A0A8H6RW62_9PEZI|nr:Aflatoxin biosynthesis regulatory protein [Pseudocercospora fuligena]